MIIGNNNTDWYSESPSASIEMPLFKLAVMLLSLLMIFCQTQAVHAQQSDRTLLIETALDPETVGRKIDILLDKEHTLTIEDIIGPAAKEFSPISTDVPDIGYSDSMVWLRLKVLNGSPDTADWRLYFKDNFKQIFHVYIAYDDGSILRPMAQDLASSFSSRPIAYPEVVVPLKLAPGRTATVYARYWTEGATYLPLSIETVDSFTNISSQNLAKQFVFYGMMIILILAAVLAGLVLRHAIFPAYIAYASSTLLYIMHSDGVGFQYIWPSLPAFNSYASVVFGGSYAISGAIYARLFLNTRQSQPIIDKLLILVIVVVSGMIFAGLFAEPRTIKRYLILVVMAAVALFTVAALLAARRRFREVRFYVFAWLGATASATLMVLRHWFGIDVSQQFQYDSMRVVMIFDAVMLGLAIVDRYSRMREERQKALKASLQQTQRNLEVSTRLRNLEARYELALEMNASHKAHLENTVHDLRQPIHALRYAVQGVIADNGQRVEENYADITNSFDYLEALVSDYIQEPAAEQSDKQANDMPLSEILGSIHQMFLPDAQAKGLRFRFVGTSLAVSVPSLPILRIVSNLVSNAIKYTPEGGLLLGVRRTDDAVRIEVHDTGIGMTLEEFRHACQRNIRLTEAIAMGDGQGHGLAIVSDLVEQNGFKIDLLSQSSKGSAIGVTIPAIQIE
jgi:signal transduction histidine kinase